MGKAPISEPEAVSALYEAAYRPDCWQSAVAGICTLLDGAAGVVFLQDTEAGDILFWAGVGTEAGEDEYRDHIKDINPRAPFSLNERPGAVAWDYRIMPEEGLRRDPFYDWLLERHALRYFVGSRFACSGSLSAFASVEWADRQGHAEKDRIAQFGRIVPHLQQAFRISRSLSAVSAQAAALDAALNMIDSGFVVLDRRGRVIFVNAYAEETLSYGDALTVEDGMLLPVRYSDRARLGAAIRAALAGGEGDASPVARTVLLTPAGGGRPLVVSISSAERDHLGAFADNAAAVVVIRDSTLGRISPDLLCVSFGLTRREAELASALHHLRDLGAAARALGMSANTARVHIRSIFFKLGVKSQLQLMAVLSGLPTSAIRQPLAKED